MAVKALAGACARFELQVGYNTVHTVRQTFFRWETHISHLKNKICLVIQMGLSPGLHA